MEKKDVFSPITDLNKMHVLIVLLVVCLVCGEDIKSTKKEKRYVAHGGPRFGHHHGPRDHYFHLDIGSESPGISYGNSGISGSLESSGALFGGSIKNVHEESDFKSGSILGSSGESYYDPSLRNGVNFNSAGTGFSGSPFGSSSSFGTGNLFGNGHGTNYGRNKATYTHTYSENTVTNQVPVAVPHPYPVPVTKEVRVLVPQPYPVPVEKRVPVPVKVTVPVHISKPYPVTVTRKIPVQVPVYVKVPHPVKVEVPVPKPYPVKVENPVPVPVKIPVYVKVPVPVKTESGPHVDHIDIHHTGNGGTGSVYVTGSTNGNSGNFGGSISNFMPSGNTFGISRDNYGAGSSIETSGHFGTWN